MTKHTYFWILAVLLFVAACVLRLYQFEGFLTFLGDQGRDAVIVKRIVTFEHFPAIGAPSSVGQIYLGPFYYYLIAPFLPLFGFNPVGLGYAVVIFSLAGTAYATYIVKKHIDTTSSLILLTFLTFSSILIELSRFSWNPNLLPFFTFLTIFFLYKWLKEKTFIYAGLFGGFLACTMQLHYLTLLIMPPLGLFVLYETIRDPQKKRFLTQAVVAGTSFVFFISPLILFDIRHGFINIKSFFTLFTQGKVSSQAPYLSRLTSTIQELVKHAFALEVAPFIAVAIVLLLAFLAYRIYVKTHSKLFLINILVLFFFILSFAALESPRHYHYFGPIYICLYLLVAMIPVLVPKRLHHIGVTTIILSLFIILNAQKYPYFRYTPNYQAAHAQNIAETFRPYIKKQPIQIVPVPTTETDGHFRYFLELMGYKMLPNDSPEQAQELYVLCFEACKPLDDPQWQVAAFSNKQIATSWKVDRVTIYKIIHKE